MANLTFAWLSATKLSLALFHFDGHTAQCSVLIGDIATAFVGVAHGGVAPVIFAVIATGGEGVALEAHVFTRGNVRTRRQHAAYFTVQNAVDIGYALSATIGVFE